MNYDFKIFDGKVAGAAEWLSREYRGLRTGRANPGILDGVQVPVYGSMVALKGTATIGVEDGRTLRIQPFDPSTEKDVERGITAANLGLGTTFDGTVIRVTFPELTGERRQEFIKLAKAKLEEARTTIRVARDESWKDIQEKERESILTEDDKFSLKEELQKKVDNGNETLEKMFYSKEEEMGA